MYAVTVTVQAKSQDEGDFDMEASVSYRNVKSTEQVDAITKSVTEGLFSLGNAGRAAAAGK